MFLKRNALLHRGAVAGVLLALSIVSILTFPVSAVAEEPGATPSDSRTAPLRPAAVLPSFTVADWQMPVKLNGNVLFTASSVGLPELGPKELRFNQPNRARPLLGPGRLFDQIDSGPTSEPEERGVRKRYLALGIVGVLGVAAGAVAVTESNKYCTTNNISGNGQVQSICSNVHTGGEVMIPVGAAAAGLGFYLAFRRRH